MHVYQGEQDLQDKSQALATPGGFQVDKETAMSAGQLSQVWNSSNTILEHTIIYPQSVVIMSLGKYSLRDLFWKNGLALTSKFQ